MRLVLKQRARQVMLVIWILAGLAFMYFRLFGRRRHHLPDPPPQAIDAGPTP